MAHLFCAPVLVLFLALLLVAEQESASSSPWLRKQVNPRKQGCRFRPWICSEGRYHPKGMCCGNRCVDISSDDANCGRCGIRCKFSRKCCSGLCVDLNRDPLHCGECFNRCRSESLCSFGLCGYAEPPLPPYMPPPPYFPQPPPLYTPPPPPHLYTPPAPPLYTPPVYTPPIPPYSPPDPPFCAPPVPPPPYSLYPPPMVPLPPEYPPSKVLRNDHHCRMPPNTSGVAA